MTHWGSMNRWLLSIGRVNTQLLSVMITQGQIHGLKSNLFNLKIFPQIFSFFYNNFFFFLFFATGLLYALSSNPAEHKAFGTVVFAPLLSPTTFFYIFPFLFFYFCFSFFLPPEGDFRRSLPKVAPITTTTTYPRWWFLICIPPNPRAPRSTHLHKRPRAPTPCLLPLTDWQKVCGVGLTKTPYIFSVSFLLL